MTLDQLRIFLAVAEREHVTRAAEALNLTQSTVSGAINALETRHDVKLFHRVGRRIELTEAGKALAEEAKVILARVRAAETAMADLSGIRRGTLTVFASQTIASYWLPRLLVRFYARYPQIDLRLEVGNTAQCTRAVMAGAADLGFIEGTIDEPSVSVELIATDRLVIVVGREHPWTKRPPVLPQDLSQTEWVLREPGSGTRSSFEGALRGCGPSPDDLRIAIELPSNEAICAAVEAGQFATAVSETVAQAGVSAGRLVIMPLELPSRAFSLIRHRERHRTRASEAFRELIVADGATKPATGTEAMPRR
ncbi:LysR substrate-binding domain-containing protein [Mesorhizobium sp. CC13]|uniref:LysR substrate-binding domain-containing protein n=1 Tax=Mesorhizobium sp. CC13 TaxID=3029194 RepID=UPI003267E9C9